MGLIELASRDLHTGRSSSILIRERERDRLIDRWIDRCMVR